MDYGEGETVSLLNVSEDCLIHIISFLDLKDLISCSLVCHQMNRLTSYDKHWKILYKKYTTHQECPRGLTWKQLFINWFHDFGRYWRIYSQVKKAWNQIETFIHQNCPHMLENLSGGASEAALDAVERKLKITLPDDFRCIYRIHDGQMESEQRVLQTGILGTIQNYDHFRNEKMVTLQELSSIPAFLLNTVAEESGLVPISFCYSSYVHQLLCVSRCSGFDIGTIYFSSGNPAGGTIKDRHCFISGRSYLEWFTNYAQELADKKFPLVNFESETYIYKFYHEPSATAITGHVRVSVATAFLPELSSAAPAKFTFAYRITMSMDAGIAPKHSCQLETRHWVITDGNGEMNRVDGPGVIGEYPVIKPGTEYSYISCTNFGTPTGEMKGTYTFRNLITSERLEVIVPVFHMTCPPLLTARERRRRLKEEAAQQTD